MLENAVYTWRACNQPIRQISTDSGLREARQQVCFTANQMGPEALSYIYKNVVRHYSLQRDRGYRQYIYVRAIERVDRQSRKTGGKALIKCLHRKFKKWR